MDDILFLDNNSLANLFIRELYIGIDWSRQSEEMVFWFACIGNSNQDFLISIATRSSHNGDGQLDGFTFAYESNNENPPNPIKMEGVGKYMGVDCYTVVNWNAISDPSLANGYGEVYFGATVNKNATTILGNSPTIKQFIYDHALDGLSRDAITQYQFTRNSWDKPNVTGGIISVGNFNQFKIAIVQNNVVINLTNDIAIIKDPSLSSDKDDPNTIEHLNTLINFRSKNLVINGNNHKVYEIETTLQTTLNQDQTRYETPFNSSLTGKEAFITPNGTIIPLARSRSYKAKGWIVAGNSRYGLSLPDELANLYQVDTDNVFVCFRLNYQRYMKKIIYASTGVVFFENTESFNLNDLTAHTPKTDFFLINYAGDGDGLLIKNGNLSYPERYGSLLSQCWAEYLVRIKGDSNVVFNNITFIGGTEYAIRNDGKLKIRRCHFTNCIGGGIYNLLQLSVKKCHFYDIKTYAVRFDHIDGSYSDENTPYMDITRCLFENIGHYGSSSFAVWSTGKAYIAYNEFIDTNYGAIRVGVDNCTSVSSRHSENLVEWNYIHYTPEWIEERQLLGLQNSGAITVVTNNEKAIIRFNRICGCGGPGKNIGIYGNNGAYNMEIYGNVISRTENYYDIDCWDASNDFTGQTPNGSYNDVNMRNLIAYNIFDGYIRIQENSRIASPECSFIKNFKLQPNPKANNTPSEVQENKLNQLDDYRNGEGIMTDESGMVAAAYLSVLGNYEPVDS